MAGVPSPKNPLRGSCLCGGVRFEVTAPFLWANHCHCSRCRKHSGAFGGAQGRIPRAGFRLLAGEELIRVFRPDGGRVKAFCSVCGSSLCGAEWPQGEEVAIRFGSLDREPGIRPQFHTFVASRAPWDEIPDDGLPHYDGGHPGGHDHGDRLEPGERLGDGEHCREVIRSTAGTSGASSREPNTPD